MVNAIQIYQHKYEVDKVTYLSLILSDHNKKSEAYNEKIIFSYIYKCTIKLVVIL